MKYFQIIFFSIFILTGFISCNREEAPDDDTDTATDFAYCKMGFGTMIPTGNNITVNEEGVRQMGVYTCATVTLISGDTTNWPNGDTLVYEVDYGTACTDHDGRIKQGKLYFSFVSDYGNTGGRLEITTQNYKVNGIEYQGEIILMNDGNNTFTQTIIGGKCLANSWTVLYEGTTTITWLSGFGTPAIPEDDIYQISENSTGTNRNGKTFSVATITPMVKKSDCEWISNGIIDVTPSGLATRRIDFGSGDCDNQATVTINGNVLNFEMQ